MKSHEQSFDNEKHVNLQFSFELNYSKLFNITTQYTGATKFRQKNPLHEWNRRLFSTPTIYSKFVAKNLN